MRLRVLALLAALVSPAAQAYCVHNQTDREVAVEQEPHPDKLREERVFRARLAPGERKCCEARNIDCNPLGRRDSLVQLWVTLPGEPAYHCGYPEDAAPVVKVTGAGTVRIQPNPRRSKGSWPYVLRVRTHDKDITGPRGLQCPQTPSKGKR